MIQSVQMRLVRFFKLKKISQCYLMIPTFLIEGQESTDRTPLLFHTLIPNNPLSSCTYTLTRVRRYQTYICSDRIQTVARHILVFEGSEFRIQTVARHIMVCDGSVFRIQTVARHILIFEGSEFRIQTVARHIPVCEGSEFRIQTVARHILVCEGSAFRIQTVARHILGGEG